MTNKFTFSNFVKESVVDIPRNSLDRDVFMFQDESYPVMLPRIKMQILEDIGKFRQVVNIDKFYVIGSILTKNYNKNSDIDVNVEVHNEDLDDQLIFNKVIMLMKELNGKIAGGTTHPINYYITKAGEYDLRKTDGAYDVESERWLKEPKTFSIKLSNYMSRFEDTVQGIDLTTAELRRDIIDYEELKTLPKEDIKDLKTALKSKLYEINQSIHYLIDIKNNMRKVRNYDFDRPMSPEELTKFDSKNTLPTNVVYKLLQKYYYWDFIHKLDEIMSEEEGEVSDNSIDDLKQAERQFWGMPESFNYFIKNYNEPVELLTEKIRKIKLKKINWKDPKVVKSHMMKSDRGMGRQNLSQVPNSQTAIVRHASWRNLGTSKRVVDNAKKASSGMWRLTPHQVKEIANKYHFFPPDSVNNIKHLGNTGILVWRKTRGTYFLIKPARRI